MSTAILSRRKVSPAQGVTTELVDVTPDIATQMLKHNRNNRALKRLNVVAFARDMATGRWIFDGAPIRFGVDGRLLDGQNRLTAVVRSGETIQFLVVRGLADAAQDVMDTGAKRTTGDQLKIRGESYATLLAAVARRAAMWDQGNRSSKGTFKPTESEIRAFIDLNPDVRAATEIASALRKSIPLPPSQIGLAYFLCARVDVLDAKSFYVDQVGNQLGLKVGYPAHALRKKFEDAHTTSELEMFCYVLRAWNIFRSGGRASILRKPADGWNATNIPYPA